MLGDVNYRLPSIVDAMTYTNAGVKTYLYYQGILTAASFFFDKFVQDLNLDLEYRKSGT